MNPNVENLLWRLRRAIDDALAESFSVASAMAALELTGHCPNLSIDVTLPEETELSDLEIVVICGPLALTPLDEEFLRSLGITAKPKEPEL